MKLFRLLFALFLLAAIPLFVWAVLTQRIELRKKAATSEPIQICWNRVIRTDRLYWPNSCKGNPRTDMFCAEILVPLTSSEINGYHQWVAMGMPYIPGCSPMAYQTYWQTPNVLLQADNMAIEVNGMTFKGIPESTILHSDPGNYNYTTLEATWKENKVEMRVFIYFSSDCTSSLPLRCNQWKVTEVRIYNGKSPGDWFIYTPSDNSYAFSQLHAPWGQALAMPSFELSSSGGGVHVLTFTNLRLQAFMNRVTPTPPTQCSGQQDGSICTRCKPCLSQICPTVCIPETATCQNGQCTGPTPTPICIPRPRCMDIFPVENRCLPVQPPNGSFCPPTPMLTPTPPAGCYYQQVQCIQAPCNPILVCPTPTPICIPRPACLDANPRCLMPEPIGGWCMTTPTPRNTCIRGKPIVTIVPNNQNGNPGDTLNYTANIVNTDSQPCGSSPFELTTQVDTNFLAQLQYRSLPIPASASAHLNFSVTSPATNTFGINRSTPISLTAINTNSNESNTGYASYTILMPRPQTMKLRVKLAGVTDGSAEGTKISVKFVKKDGSVLQLSELLALTYAGSGIYNASAVISNPFAGGTQMRIKIKGEKHVAIEFCRQSGQTGPCGDNEYITVANPFQTDYIFDFTGIPLPPGDLTVQDGQANRADLDKLTALMSKLCENLTIAEKIMGDVDYNGCVNVRDVFLILQTLETRFDE